MRVRRWWNAGGGEKGRRGMVIRVSGRLSGGSGVALGYVVMVNVWFLTIHVGDHGDAWWTLGSAVVV